MKILLHDHTTIDRRALRHLLEQQDRVQIIAETQSEREVVTAVRQFLPDVVVLDVDGPDMNGVAIVLRILAEAPATKVIALSSKGEQAHAYDLMDAGASAFVAKHQQFGELIRAVDAVIRGEVHVSDQFLRAEEAAAFADPPATSSLSVLSPRERDVLRQVAEGKSSKEIAAEMRLSLKTIESHRLHITTKLGIRSVAGLTKFAIREGLTPLDR